MRLGVLVTVRGRGPTPYIFRGTDGVGSGVAPAWSREQKGLPLNVFVDVHDALRMRPRATRNVIILVLVIVLAYVVGDLLGNGDAIACAAIAAVVGVLAERLTRLVLRSWIRVV